MPAFIGRVKANPETLIGFLPRDVPAHPDARQRQQRKRHFHQTLQFGYVMALERHSTGTDLLAGGDYASTVGHHDTNLGHDRDTHVAAEFVEHQHPRRTDQLHPGGPLPWFLKYRGWARLQKTHGL